MQVIETTARPVHEYVETQRDRIAKSRNARKWFYRGVVTTFVGLALYAKVTADKADNTNKDEAN